MKEKHPLKVCLIFLSNGSVVAVLCDSCIVDLFDFGANCFWCCPCHCYRIVFQFGWNGQCPFLHDVHFIANNLLKEGEL